MIRKRENLLYDWQTRHLSAQMGRDRCCQPGGRRFSCHNLHLPHERHERPGEAGRINVIEHERTIRPKSRRHRRIELPPRLQPRLASKAPHHGSARARVGLIHPGRPGSHPDQLTIFALHRRVMRLEAGPCMMGTSGGDEILGDLWGC